MELTSLQEHFDTVMYVLLATVGLLFTIGGAFIKNIFDSMKQLTKEISALTQTVADVQLALTKAVGDVASDVARLRGEHDSCCGRK
jgi:hypothetical protein